MGKELNQINLDFKANQSADLPLELISYLYNIDDKMFCKLCKELWNCV